MKRILLLATVLVLTSMSFTSCEKEEEPEKQSTSLPDSQRQVDPGTSIPDYI
jgi:hypothetical protein